MREFMERILKRKQFIAEISDLVFGNGNSKFDDIITFSLPAGHSCPFAKDCRSCAMYNPRKRHDIGDKRKFIIQDGPKTIFRCFTAIDEVLRPVVREACWRNYLILLFTTAEGKWATVKRIEKTLPHADFIPTRVHVAGDYFNQVYFDAWMEVARRHPNRIFYSYTKALPFWVKRLGTIPKNFKLTASYGGTHDWMIKKYGLRSVKVVTSAQDARMAGLPIDHDDSHAYGDGGDFALLLHGQQPKGPMAMIWAKLKRMGKGGYGKQKASTVKD